MPLPIFMWWFHSPLHSKLVTSRLLLSLLLCCIISACGLVSPLGTVFVIYSFLLIARSSTKHVILSVLSARSCERHLSDFLGKYLSFSLKVFFGFQIFFIPSNLLFIKSDWNLKNTVEGRLGDPVGSVFNFSSGHDLVVREFEPCRGLCAGSSEPGACFRFCVCVCVCVCVCPFPACTLSLSVSQKWINVKKKKF